MHKILFTLFLLVVLLFPKSEVLGQTACPPGHTGSLKTSGVSPASACGVDACFKTNSTNSSLFDCYERRSIPGAVGPAARPGEVPADATECKESVSVGAGTATQFCEDSKNKTIINGKCYCIGTSTSKGCKTDPSGKQDPSCTSAKGVPCTESKNGIMTAIGCVPTEPKALVEGILKYGTVAAGAIAFLLMILGALQMITAEGNPESIKAAQERFYSAIIGLLLIIFAVLLMQVIGVDILGLPGLGKQPPAFDTSKGDSS